MTHPPAPLRATKRVKLPTDAPAGLVIMRDSHGIPHVQAPDVPTAAWGLGYAHATDRAMQMVLMRTLGQGRGCELLDDTDDMLDIDRFFRGMNWAGHTQAERDQLTPDATALCAAYVDGVNARLSRHLPWELKLIGMPFEPWTVDDTVLLSRMTGYLTLAQSQAEIEQLYIEMVKAGVPDAQLEAVFPCATTHVPRAVLEAVYTPERVVPAAVKWQSLAPRAMASNSWVVSGAHSASGAPVLANDPHLEINRLPNVWVEFAIELPERTLVGANMPGLPGPLVGRSDQLAWGATYTFMDAVDHWVEDVKNGMFRRGDNDWQAFDVRHETIVRKKHDDVTATYFENMHGVLAGDPRTDTQRYMLSRRWSATRSGARSINALCDMWHADTVDDGMAALGQLETAWNWIFADTAGDIGYQMSGVLPVRHPDANGFVPMPGWDPAFDWQGEVAREDLPRVKNPKSGIIVTANNDLNGLRQDTAAAQTAKSESESEGEPALTGAALSGPGARPINMPMGDYRAVRIQDVLEKHGAHDLASMSALQMDTKSVQADAYLTVLRPLLVQSKLKDTDTARLLSAWDGHYDVNDRAPVAFEQFYKALIVELCSPHVGKDVMAHLLGQTGVFIDFYQQFDRLLLAESSPWHGARTREAIYLAALNTLPARLTETWGDVNHVTLSHLVLGDKLPRLFGFDVGPIPLPGGRATPHQGQVYESAGRKTSFAPSLRLVADMADPYLYCGLIGGPSDRRFSKHYTSDVANWRGGRLKTLGRLKTRGG